MKPVAKWASIGAAIAFIQYFIFNGAHQNGLADRIAFGLLGILIWSILGAAIGFLIDKIKGKQ